MKRLLLISEDNHWMYAYSNESFSIGDYVNIYFMNNNKNYALRMRVSDICNGLFPFDVDLIERVGV